MHGFFGAAQIGMGLFNQASVGGLYGILGGVSWVYVQHRPSDFLLELISAIGQHPEALETGLQHFACAPAIKAPQRLDGKPDCPQVVGYVLPAVAGKGVLLSLPLEVDRRARVLGGGVTFRRGQGAGGIGQTVPAQGHVGGDHGVACAQSA